MKSILAKIVLWAVGTTAVSLLGFALTSRLIWETSPGPIDPIVRFHVLLLDEAIAAYRQGGPTKLAAYLRRLDERFDARHYLVDAAGRDLVDGRDRSALLAAGSVLPAAPRRLGNELVIVTPEADTRLIITVPLKFGPWGFLPYYLWIFLLVVGLGYVLAMHLVRPLHRLRLVVEGFGRGDLAIRSRSVRRDEIGELARAFDRMAERTEALMTAQSRLLQDVSHELRSPLARLQLVLRLARDGNNKGGALDRIKKEVDRLSTLVDELIQVASAEHDALTREAEELQLEDLVAGLVEDAAVEARARAAGWNSLPTTRCV